MAPARGAAAELWKAIAKIDRSSNAPGTANVGRWITAAALWNLATPERGKLTPKNWPAFHRYFVVEFARLVKESGAVTEFKNRPAQGSQFKPSVPCGHRRDRYVTPEKGAQPMAAYVIANIRITDPDRYPEYASRVPQTIECHGGRYLARGGQGRGARGRVGAPTAGHPRVREHGALARLICRQGYEGIGSDLRFFASERKVATVTLPPF